MPEEKKTIKKPTIWESLKAVSTEMPVIGRNKTADVGKFKYSYANLEKIWEIAKPIIEKHGFIVYHAASGNTVKTTIHHESGKDLESTIEISQLDPQKKGAEITYYKRYNLCMLFNIIVADEDKDAKGTEEVTTEKLATIEEQVALLNTVDELTGYHKQLGSPKDKKILSIFSARKKQIV